MALQRRFRTEPQWDRGVSPVVQLGLRFMFLVVFLLSPASGSGRRPPNKAQKEREKRGLRKSGPYLRQYEGGNSRVIFTVYFLVFFGHAGAGGPQMDTTTFFLKILLVEAFLP